VVFEGLDIYRIVGAINSLGYGFRLWCVYLISAIKQKDRTPHIVYGQLVLGVEILANLHPAYFGVALRDHYQ